MKSIFVCITVALFLSLSVPARAAVTGQWDFNSGNLAATIGTALAYRGDTAASTVFTTGTIGGQTAKIMQFPATTPTQGYTLTHGIAPNGGGLYVNQYTLILDIMFPTDSASGWRSLLQTVDDDGDLFVDPDGGIGIDGVYDGTILAETWHRVAFVVDLTLGSGHLRKFIDGVQVGAQDLDGLDGRWSLRNTALLFADDNSETALGYVNSIQIHNVALSISDIFALGSASAAGIPTTIPVLTDLNVTVTPTSEVDVVGMTATPFTAIAIGPGTLRYQWYRNNVAVPGQTNAALRLPNLQLTNAGNYTVVVTNSTRSVTSSPPAALTVNPAPPTFVTGQWDFNQQDLRATIGQALQFSDATVQADTRFGTTTFFGVSSVAGQTANVMECNPTTAGLTNWDGFVLPHGIAPNGGGANVNQYTVILDLFYPTATAGFYRALWQTDTSNTSEGDVFIDYMNGLGVGGQYDGALSLDGWHRVVLAFDLARREFGKYIDGTNVVSAPKGASPHGPHDAQYLSANTDPTVGGGVDMRWSLSPTALLLADNDGDARRVYVSSVQVRNGRMTDAAIAALGPPTAGKIPGYLKASRSGNSVIIDWTGAVLEQAPSVTGAWSVVAGAAHPHTVPAPTGNKFYRVQR